MIRKAAALFGLDAARLLRTASCESGLRANAVSASGAYAGVFQQARSYWPARAYNAGMAGRSVFDAWANVYVSAWMIRHAGGWQHWPTCAYR